MAIFFGLQDMDSDSFGNGPAASAVRKGGLGGDVGAVSVAGAVGEAGRADRIGATALAMGENRRCFDAAAHALRRSMKLGSLGT
jgi:hypothetical protein